MKKDNDLLFYARIGDLAKVKEAIEHGFDVNSVDEYGYTALHWASQEGYIGIALLLLNKGCRLDIRDSEGFMPLEIAVTKQHVALVKIFLEHKPNIQLTRDGFTPLHAASAVCNSDLVKLLINYGYEVNTQDKHLRCPIHWATQEGCYDCLIILLDKGAYVDSIDIDNFTALHIACSFGYIEIAKTLLDYGANVNVTTSEQATALHYAYGSGYYDIAQLLIRKGANITTKDVEGKTPIECAK